MQYPLTGNPERREQRKGFGPALMKIFHLTGTQASPTLLKNPVHHVQRRGCERGGRVGPGMGRLPIGRGRRGGGVVDPSESRRGG